MTLKCELDLASARLSHVQRHTEGTFEENRSYGFVGMERTQN